MLTKPELSPGLQPSRFLAGVHVPQPHCTILAAAGQRLPIRREGHAQHFLRVTAKQRPRPAQQLLAQPTGADAEEICMRLSGQVAEWAAGVEQFDDITILVLSVDR